MDACIALRTMIVRDGTAYLQAGAGIVADSDPEAEHEECLASSRRWRRPSTSRNGKLEDELSAHDDHAVDSSESRRDGQVTSCSLRRSRTSVAPGAVVRRGARATAQSTGNARTAEGRTGKCAVKVLMIDNYDSFTYNLVHLFEQLGAEVLTFRNDAITADEAMSLGADRLVVSPGPGRPEDAGVSVDLLRAARPDHEVARRVPRPPGDRQRVRRRDRPGSVPAAREGEPGRATTATACTTGCRTRSRSAATTRSPRPRCPTRCASPPAPTTAR